MRLFYSFFAIILFSFFTLNIASDKLDNQYLQRDTVGGKVDRLTLAMKRAVARFWLKFAYGFKYVKHLILDTAKTVAKVPRKVTSWALETLPVEERFETTI